MKLALLYNARPGHLPPGALADDAFEEYDRPETIAAIQRALCGMGAEVEPIEADRRMPRRLEQGNYDFAFNIAEGRGRRCREAIAAAVCELLELPYTGSDALTLAATLDKEVARRLVSPNVPVAPAVLLTKEGEEEDEAELERLRYPVLVKPNDEGSSKGIHEDAIAENSVEAMNRVRRLRALYGCPVLVEEYLSGVELTVGIIGNGVSAEILGVMEIAPAADEPRFVYSVEVKRDWRRRVRYHIPPRLPAHTVDTVSRNALAAYRLLGCRDFARLDFRLDSAGRPCFLECNPLPGLDPESSDIVILSRHHTSHEKLIQRILLEAVGRCKMDDRFSSSVYAAAPMP
jgi:D-alanine-D-alanine ligase